MSAWLCDDELFIQLSAYFVNAQDIASLNTQAMQATQLANRMKAQNIASLDYRYRQGASDFGSLDAIEVHPGEVIRASQIDPVCIIKACDCFDYQACETPHYETSSIAREVDQIRRAAIRKLPGYDAAPWGTPHEFEAAPPNVISLYDMANNVS